MNKPKFLARGDKVVIVSPSGKINKEKIFFAKNIFEDWGLIVELGSFVSNEYFQFAGTDKQRLIDMQKALDSEEIKAIFCSRGGYGAVRIIDKLNFSQFLKNPKWLIGYSDITVLHNTLNNIEINSIHGMMPTNINTKTQNSASLQTLKNTLFGKQLKYLLKPNKLNKLGTAKAEIIGGNLTILYSLSATEYDIKTKHKILFIEDINEYLYNLDRIMNNFKLSGKLKKLSGLIVGGFTDMQDNNSPFGKSYQEIILDSVKEYDFPVCFDFPAGHISNNFPIILGAEIVMEVNADRVKVIFN